MYFKSHILICLYLSLVIGEDNEDPKKLLTESKFRGRFYVYDDVENVKELKWVYIYSFNDESKIIGINQNVLSKDSTKFNKVFVPSKNYIILKPKEFKTIFLFLALKNDNSLEILNLDYRIFVYRSFNPYFVTIYHRSRNDTWRGIKMDWSETSKLMRNASQLMHDLGI